MVFDFFLGYVQPKVFSCDMKGLPISFASCRFCPVYFNPTDMFWIKLNWIPRWNP
jgi:hypothetical protein